MAPSPSMPEGQILGHRYTKKVGKIGDCHRAVGPGAGAVDRVSVNHICRIVGSDIVGVAAVPVI